jgi:flagellar FliL protein
MAKTSSTPEEAAGAGTPKPARGSMLGKVLVLGLVVLVVAVECLVAYLCIPAASDSASAASNAAKPPADHKRGESDPAAEGEGPANLEVDLKEYQVTRYQPTATWRIEFHLYGIVAANDKQEFDRLFELNQSRFREQVGLVVRSAEMADLTDPSLGLIKRTILEKARSILGKQLLQELVINDYSTIEN